MSTLTHDQKMVKQRRMEHAVGRLQAKDLIYDLGGARFAGRITSPIGDGTAWTDCSGFAVFLIQVGGFPTGHLFPDGVLWTGSIADNLPKGVSDYLTFFLKEPHETEGHVIIRLRQRPKPFHKGVPHYRWAECGGSDNPHPGGGPTWLTPGRAMGLSIAERVGEFDYHRCIEGF